MSTLLIPFTLAWLIGMWIASRIALPTLAFGIAAIVAVVGLILTSRAEATLGFRPCARGDAGCTPLQPRATTL